MQSFEVDLGSLTNRLDVAYYRVRAEVIAKLGPKHGVPLSLLCAHIRTKTPARDAYSEAGVPCIKLRNVTGNFIDLIDCDYIPLRLKGKYVTAKKYDLIVTATGEGTAGRVDMFFDDSVPCVVTGENILLRPNKDGINPFYLLAALRTGVIAMQLRYFVRGATGQTHLYWHDIGNIQIPEASDDIQADCERMFRDADKVRRQAEKLLSEFRAKAEEAIRQRTRRKREPALVARIGSH
jgi:hypothetical protein